MGGQCPCPAFLTPPQQKPTHRPDGAPYHRMLGRELRTWELAQPQEVGHSTTHPTAQVPDARHRPGFDELANRILLLMEEATNQISDPVRTIWYRTPLAPLLSKHMAKCHRAQREVVAFHTTTAARLLSRWL
ncbi:hypothetical protein Vretifemale_4365 [Volvox reticuliferus]|uniref:Uncharacterized protein n=1 Tax=Volvox reticuliferus TaxID=1737510 RepID=A0A8J4C6N4_9CHLO|nr:hypothetical protein Vretifemale_4365 [Volvox reticuliferus]